MTRSSADTAARFHVLYGKRILRTLGHRVPLGPSTRNLTGEEFTRLTVLYLHSYSKHRRPIWVCQCSCGRRCLASTPTLRARQVKSCGCLRDEKARANMLALVAKQRAARQSYTARAA